MNAFSVTVWLLFFGWTLSSFGQSVSELSWPSNHASIPAEIPANSELLVPLIQMGIASVPEATLMRMSGSGAVLMGLPENKAISLQNLLVKYYGKIENDPLFRNLPSSLPYCFATEKPKIGKALVYIPENASPQSSVILFLHGYGGSFQFYLHLFSSGFPNHIVICPAFGISMAGINSNYLDECLSAVSSEIKFPVNKPALVGLSAGGFGGFRESVRRPEKYRQFICIAAYPPKQRVAQGLPVRILAGGNESFVTDGTLKSKVAKIRSRNPKSNIEISLIPGGDHFFLLSHEEESLNALQRWIQ